MITESQFKTYYHHPLGLNMFLLLNSLRCCLWVQVTSFQTNDVTLSPWITACSCLTLATRKRKQEKIITSEKKVFGNTLKNVCFVRESVKFAKTGLSQLDPGGFVTTIRYILRILRCFNVHFNASERDRNNLGKNNCFGFRVWISY